MNDDKLIEKITDFLREAPKEISAHEAADVAIQIVRNNIISDIKVMEAFDESEEYVRGYSDFQQGIINMLEPWPDNKGEPK